MNRLNKIKGVNKKRFQSIKLILLTLVLLFSNLSLSQNNIERYTIGEIEVSGNTSFSPITIVTFSGLREGDAISIPGEKLSNAIKKLWGSNLFSSVDVYKTNIENGVIDLEIELYDLPELTDLKITGVKKRKIEEIIKGVDAKSLRDMSKVMKVIKENLSGKCDMQMASNLVKSKLSG